MLLRHDDPLVKPLQALGAGVPARQQSKRSERIAKLIYDKTADQGFAVVRVTVWENADLVSPSFALILSVEPFQLIVFDLDGTLGIRARYAKRQTRCSKNAAPSRSLKSRSDGWSATALRHWWHAPSQRPAWPRLRMHSNASWRSTGRRLLAAYRPYPGVPEVPCATSPSSASLALLTNKPLAATHEFSTASISRVTYSFRRIVGGDGPFPENPDPLGLQHLVTIAGARAEATVMVGDSANRLATAPFGLDAICLARYGFGFEVFRPVILRGLDRTIA